MNDLKEENFEKYSNQGDDEDFDDSLDIQNKEKLKEFSPKNQKKFSPFNKRFINIIKKEEEILFDINFFADFDIFSLARHNRYVELEDLFLKGIDPDSRDNFGNTILIVASQNGNKRIVKLALRYGSKINLFNIMGNTALHFCYEYNYYEIADYLKSKGANPNIKNIRNLKATDGIRIKNNKKLINYNNGTTSNFLINNSHTKSKFMKLNLQII